MKYKTYHTVERQETSIPIKEILNEEGTPHIFPEVRSKQFFDIDFRHDRLVLVAGKYIGLIPINETVAISVEPKVGIANLVRIISKSREHLDSLYFFERQYKQVSESSPTIFEFFANCLSIELQKIEREGILRQYLPRHANLPGPRGRVNVGRTAAADWARGTYYRVCCDYFEFTADNPYNRLVKFTLWYCLNHLLNLGSPNHELIRSLCYFDNFFESVPLDKQRRFLDAVISDLREQKLPQLRLYYENICKICRCIIEDIGLMLTEPGDDIKTLSFIINMENVFEKYALHLLRESSHVIGADAKVLDGNKEGKGYLFQDTRKYEAKPDIIIRKEGRNELIIDAKYKTKASEPDRYQIIAHALSYGVKKAILLLPVSIPANKGLIKLGTAGKEYSVDLFEYYLDLENQNLEAEEKAFVNEVRALCA